MFRPEDTTALTEASGQSLAKDLGWTAILAELLTSRTLPGNHFSMMTRDHIAGVADGVNELLAGTPEYGFDR
jgi:thioesterase domain-containing protein